MDILKFNLASNVTSYINSLNSVGCNFHIDKPTRITSSSSTCIDHVYSNIKTELLDNHIILSDVSDHFGIITKLCGNTKWEREYPQSYRKTNLSEHEWGNFNRELKINLLDKFSEISCIDNNDVNFTAESITQIYNDLVNKYMPLRNFTRKQKRFFHKPWITKGIKKQHSY